MSISDRRTWREILDVTHAVRPPRSGYLTVKTDCGINEQWQFVSSAGLTVCRCCADMNPEKKLPKGAIIAE